MANIEPHIRRQKSELKAKDKLDKYQEMPIHKDGIVNTRLKSRKPFLLRPQIITETMANTPDAWQAEWQIKTRSHQSRQCAYPRNIWIRLNRIHSGQGRCNKLMYKWKFQGESGMRLWRKYTINAAFNSGLPFKKLRWWSGRLHQSDPWGSGLVTGLGCRYLN